jgi:hypothetical protein
MSDEDYRRGYRDGWKDRGNELVPKTSPSYPTFQGYPGAPTYPGINDSYGSKCRVCGMSGLSNYVCPRSDCPGKITAGTPYIGTGGTALYDTDTKMVDPLKISY